MIDAEVIFEWWIGHCASQFEVSQKFDIPIEQVYELLKEGHAKSKMAV